ncbi:MAG: Crp/Fnr family transcriptional regulator [Anaerolineae bacterium]|nr:Crp/Fnr family transcriptional regulator [Anaerolineae bacterium]MDW8071899.1 Crp/Fnr family transcriptional regulator [Anaerolineae bacterium]
MVSPELLRRYPFFSGLDEERLVFLAKAAQEDSVAAGEYFFRDGDTLNNLYILMDGEVAITATLPTKGREIVLSTISPGEVFAWSALVPPYQATSAAKAMAPCRVIALDCAPLRARFEQDHTLGYLLMAQLAQVMRDRIRAMRMETITCFTE